MSSAIEFRHVNPELYRHPLERVAKARIEMIPGYYKALDLITENVGFKMERQAEIASMAKVGSGVYGKLFDAWNNVQAAFGLADIPLHISFDSPVSWCIRGNNEHPVVIIDGKWLDILPEREMKALLAHQAGSVRLGNATYLAAADFFRTLASYSGIVGAPASVMTWGIESWRKYALYSADRAAALSVGDPDAMLALLARVSGGNIGAWGGISDPEQLRIQGIEATSLQQDRATTRLQRFAMVMSRQNHAGLIRRVDLSDWFAGGNPARILEGALTEPETPNAKTESDASAQTDDPGLAFWGEFASASPDEGASCNSRCPMMDVFGMAEKGMSTFWKAGQNFLKTFQDKKNC
jgi:hypothetical protein